MATLGLETLSPPPITPRSIHANPVPDSSDPDPAVPTCRCGRYSKPESRYHQVFNNNSRVMAVRTSGNVFSAEAVEELNFKAKSWNDLLTGEVFTKRVSIHHSTQVFPG